MRACGADMAEWSARWREVSQAAGAPGERPCPSAQSPARADSRYQAAAGELRAKGRIAAAALAAMAAAACVTAVVL